MTVPIKTGDTRTPIAAKLKTPKGKPVDLTDAEVRFYMRASRPDALNRSQVPAGGIILDKEALIIDAKGGRVAYAFDAGETDQAGIYHGEFVVTYRDASIETFPNEGYILINIGNSLR